MDFVKCYRENGTGGTPALLGKRKETDRLKKFTYDEIVDGLTTKRFPYP